jgi:hypothetical protein
VTRPAPGYVRRHEQTIEARETTVQSRTFVELIGEATEKADALRRTYQGAQAGREFALAITALEDAQMRFTRGLAMVQDKFAPVDLEK